MEAQNTGLYSNNINNKNQNSSSEGSTQPIEPNQNEPNEKKIDIEFIKGAVEQNNFKFIDIINSGNFGIVVIAKQFEKKFAIKIIDKKENRSFKPEKVRGFRGINIIKIFYEKLNLKYFKKDKTSKIYHFYVMELSFIGRLSSFDEYLYNNLIFKEVFAEKFGDNLIRFFAKQLFKAIETLHIGNLVHFDIKPNNILMFKGLEIKLIDFSFLNELGKGKEEKQEKGKIVGGTPGYYTPEYFASFEERFDNDILKKQDYFAIGLVLYMLKYRYKYSPIPVYKGKIGKEFNDFNLNITIDFITRALYHIKSQKFQDNNFTEFLCNLLQYKPEYRLNFKQIMTNKWLNENLKEIKKIKNINISDEDNLKLELQKSDFLINNRKYFRKDFDEKYNKDIKKYKYVRKGKFKFCKRY